MSVHKLFVYGTLRKGFGNNRLLTNAKFIGNATIKGVMYSLGYFPCVHLTDTESIVHGEVYEVDAATLANCDRLEGYSPERDSNENFYTRSMVSSSLGTDVFVYHHVFPRTHLTVVRSGDWTNRNGEVRDDATT